MARIFPFRALRYNPSLVRVEDCVTQPYDKITPSLQQSYYARSPYNLVRIILGLPELFDEAGANDVYTRAARDFREWRAEGVLAQETEPCLFAYEQRFTPPGPSTAPGTLPVTVTIRRGLIALGAVSPYSEGVVFRHEQTHTRARTDRLSLLRATRAHFGQIFMLYSDPARSVESLVFPAAGKPAPVPEIELEDEFGVLHRVWKISDPATINVVQGALGDKKLIIADGHHRYETALAYAQENAPARTQAPRFSQWSGGIQQPPYPEAAVMMTLVNMDGGGVHILPTHRVVHGLANFSGEEFAAQAATMFTSVQPVSADPRNSEALTAALAQATAQTGRLANGRLANGRLANKGVADEGDATVMLAVVRDQVLALTMDRAARQRALPEMPERKRQLDMVVLHEVVLDRLLGIRAEAVEAGEHVRYERDVSEATAPVLRGEAQIAFLVNPVTLAQLRENTFAGEVMPQKSTDFYPKLLSGLAIYALDEQTAQQKGER